MNVTTLEQSVLNQVFKLRKSRLDQLYTSMTPVRNMAVNTDAKWNEIVEAFKAGKKIIDLSVDMFDFEVIGADHIKILLGDKDTSEVFITYWYSNVKNIEWGDFCIYGEDE